MKIRLTVKGILSRINLERVERKPKFLFLFFCCQSKKHHKKKDWNALPIDTLNKHLEMNLSEEVKNRSPLLSTYIQVYLLWFPSASSSPPPSSALVRRRRISII